MDAIFLNLVNISITASYIAIAVILFRFLLKKAPKAYTCILWLLVALRLILPVSDSSKFSFSSIFSLIPSAEVLPNTLIDNASPQFNINVGIEQIDRRVNDYLDDRYAEGVTVPANAGSNLMNILGCIWIIICIAIILYAIGSYIYFRRKTKASICVKGNTFICDYISTPFILGIIKPKILLPSTLSEEESRYVLAHERAHLKRLDYLWKPLGFILLSIHWFNPIMWISYILFCRDIELACDEYVIKNMNSDDKKAYSTALLNCSVPKKLLSAYPLAFGEIGVKERIKAVLKYKKPAVITSIIAIILCVVTALCFLANPKKSSLIEELSELESSDIYSIDFNDGKVFSFTDNESYIETIMNTLNEIEMGKIPFKNGNSNIEYKTITICYPKESNFYYDSESKA
ncbi:MAG: M56 family metallopeptidase, partial [Eubacterium sp.]|nr:M56 family metallopeptidase [Eubacterium sp.]